MKLPTITLMNCCTGRESAGRRRSSLKSPCCRCRRLAAGPVASTVNAPRDSHKLGIVVGSVAHAVAGIHLVQEAADALHLLLHRVLLLLALHQRLPQQAVLL